MTTFLDDYQNPNPTRLSRHFKTRDHAQEFLKGNIRLGLHKTYSRDQEGERLNRQEGLFQGIMVEPNGEKFHFIESGIYPIYCLCCFRPEADARVQSKYGEFIVDISDPMELHKRLIGFLGDASSSAYAGNIVYRRSETKRNQFDSRFFSIYAGKPQSYKTKEFRFAYDIDTEKTQDLANAQRFFLSAKKYKNYSHIPSYITLRGVQVSDILKERI